jgi:hypothetical protein
MQIAEVKTCLSDKILKKSKKRNILRLSQKFDSKLFLKKNLLGAFPPSGIAAFYILGYRRHMIYFNKIFPLLRRHFFRFSGTQTNCK